MKTIKLLLLIISLTISYQLFGQTEKKYTGTVNGLLIVKNENNKKILYDFQGSQASMIDDTDHDPEGPQNSSFHYYGKTTSGNTNIKYQYYNIASLLAIELNNEWFEIRNIDGASDWPLEGLDYTFEEEVNTKYLILRVTKELELKNTYTSEIRKTIKVLPKSTLIFAINTNQ